MMMVSKAHAAVRLSKLLSLLLVSGVLTLSACSSSPAEPASSSAGNSGEEIVFIGSDAQDEFSKRIQQDVIAQLESEGGYRVTSSSTPEGVEAQKEMLVSAAKDGQKTIVVSVNSPSGWEGAIAEAKGHGAAVFFVGSPISSGASTATAAMTFDPASEGVTSATWIAAEAAGSDIVILASDSADDTVRNAELQRILTDQIVGVVDGFNSGGVVSEALPLVMEEYPDVATFYVDNEDAALAVAQLLEEQTPPLRKDWTVLTVGGKKAVLEALRQGKLQHVTYRSPLLGSRFTELLQLHFAGTAMPTDNSVPVRGLDKSISSEVIEELGY